jgi:hypothetical protein
MSEQTSDQLQRDEKFQIRMTSEERRMLEALAENEGLTASDKVRQLIRKDFLVTFGQATTRRKKPRK